MAQYSKQSGESAIAFADNVFFWARLKLTGIYVLILALILVGFSAILYQNIQRNLLDASDDEFSGIESHRHFTENTLENIQNEIVVIDLVILIAAAGMSYVFAGYTLKPIQRSMEAQKKFTENASHELRTPLAVMKNDIEVLLRNSSPTKHDINATLSSSIEEIDRMSNMAEDLLMLARSENHIAPTMENVDITAIAQKTAEKMRLIATQKGVKIESVLSGPQYILGNSASLERVVFNLLRNSLEYTPPNGSVMVGVEKKGTQVILKVSDTGSGIDEKDLPHVFERFYKGEDAQGSGLGLSIVKTIVTQHQGDVEIQSTKGKGTTVSMNFPLLSQ